MDYQTILFSEVFLIVGVVVGWIASERFYNYMMKNAHEFEELFDENPHPEIFDKDGKVYRGEYLAINFEPGYDPEQFDPEDLHDE